MKNNSQSFLPKFIFLCIITTSIVTTLSLSKYQSTIAGTSNVATVSRPILNVALAENQKESLQIDCNEDETSTSYSIVVSNKENDIISEVSLKYDITITFPPEAEVPDGLTLKIDNKNLSKSGNTYTIKNIGQFSPSYANENTHTLTFKADPNIIRSCSFEDITITVYAEQID